MLPNNLLILDIVTVGQTASFENLSLKEQKYWKEKSKYISEDSVEENYKKKAGVYAEFGKIVGIGMARLDFKAQAPKLHVKTILNTCENSLISDFFSLINTKFNPSSLILCAHNGKEFDYPYICRRAIINEIQLPPIFDLSGKQSWNVKHLDTMQLWKFGDYKNFTPLELLAHSLGINLKSDLIEGSKVSEYFHKEDMNSIKNYLEQQVILTSQVLLKLKNKQIISDNNINIL